MKLYRARVRVPEAYVHVFRSSGPNGQQHLLDDVRSRLGCEEVLSVMQDPTEITLFSVLVRGITTQSDGTVTIEHVEQVEEPPASTTAPAPDYVSLDPGLGREDLMLLHCALTREWNPRHVGGVAMTFAPFFPCAASLLQARATLLEGRCIANDARLDNANAQAAMQASVPRVRVSPGEELASLVRSRTWGRWHAVEQAFRDLCPTTRPWTRSEDVRSAIATARGLPPEQSPDIELPHAVARVAAWYEAHPQMPIEVLRDETRRAAWTLVDEPLETRVFPDEVLALARCLVREIGCGVWIVDPARLESAIPPDGLGREGFVSPSALQLALANGKPAHARVWNASRIKTIATALTDGGDTSPNALLARNQLERAERAIERRRWIEWYRRSSAQRRLDLRSLPA